MKTVYLPSDRAFVRYIEIPGSDPPLLWLHGWQCSSTGELLPAAVRAPLRGRRSLLIDLLGHGYSDRPSDFGYRLEAQSKEAEAQPSGLRAAHLGIARLVEPRALHREAVSLEAGTNPSVRSLVRNLQMPRWYLQGEASDPEPDLQRDLAAMGIGWKVVPNTGHPMGLQNPDGFAQTVAEVLAESWPT